MPGDYLPSCLRSGLLQTLDAPKIAEFSFHSHEPGGNRLRDLVGPGEDPGHPDIPPGPGDEVLLAVAVAAEEV